MERTLERHAIIVAAQEHISCDLDGEVAILDMQSGTYYGLNAVGTRIWQLLQEPRMAYEVREALLEEYEVEPEACERDVFALLQTLADKGLIEVKDGTPV